MLHKFHRSPTGEIVLQLGEDKGTDVTAIFSREEAHRLLEGLKGALELSALITWQDMEFDGEMAEQLRHGVSLASRTVTFNHGLGDKLRANIQVPHEAAARLSQDLSAGVARQRSGRVDRIESDDDGLPMKGVLATKAPLSYLARMDYRAFLGNLSDPKAPKVKVDLLGQDGAVYAMTALIDTGADITCIADHAVTRLGYRPVTEVDIVSASGRNRRGVYRVRLRFPLTEPPHLAVVEVAGLPELGDDGRPDMLLGRDVLEQGSFCWHGDGTTELRFRGAAR